MKTVGIADLKDNLSFYLNKIVHGEEIIIRNRKKPIAKIVPLNPEQDADAEELALVADGIMRLPQKPLSKEFWKHFWSMPMPEISGDALAALTADRNED